ncbi:MAG: alanine:cation symporter family protein [Chloroflexales bacterium]|nr:alanine:cation symporter family protein [Chloroflexales bacterium]
MKKTVIALGVLFSLMLMPAAAFAQESSDGGGIDQRINSIFEPISKAVESVVFYSVPIAGTELPLIVVWLVVAAIFFTFYFRFINLRAFLHAFRLIRGDFDDKESSGEVSHFQALATALSGTVGLGNIAGVAVAVSLGGPGATLWMIIAGFFGMTTKFVECTLGVKYRNEYPDGSVSGGPMYYLSKGMAEKNIAGLGKVMAAFFAVCCVGGSLGGGNMFQVNQAYKQFVNVTGGDSSFFADKGWLFGLIIAAIVAAVIIGGIKSIARVTEKVVPFMAVTYIAAGLVIIFANITLVPAAFGAIVQGAFTPEGITGGFIGVLIQGFRRSAFSNEAGIGSAAIAHSAVKTKEPITEGIVALYEPMIDTIIICTMTALVIVITGTYTNATEALDGVQLTSAAFAQNISWFPYVLSLAVVLFAFSTMLSWSYYGLKCWTYLLGEGQIKELVFKAIFCIFIVIGATMSLDAVIGFSDAMLFAMSVPNIIGLYFLAPVVKRALDSYWARVVNGEIASTRNVQKARKVQA